ncbi:MAG: Lrp/AsnC family transcriptional regulator [archaeon]
MNKQKELLLMSHFRSNARESLTRLSKKTHIPVSTIFDKLKEFENSVISKHTSLIDFRKLGFDLKVHMMFKVNKENREDFQKFLLRHPRINSIFRINNGFDYLVEVIFRDMKELQEFGEKIDYFNIEQKQDFFVLEDLKREEFLSFKSGLGVLV